MTLKSGSSDGSWVAPVKLLHEQSGGGRFDLAVKGSNNGDGFALVQAMGEVVEWTSHMQSSDGEQWQGSSDEGTSIGDDLAIACQRSFIAIGRLTTSG